MALKWRFFFKKHHENRTAAGGLAPRPLFVVRVVVPVSRHATCHFFEQTNLNFKAKPLPFPPLPS